MRKILQSEHFNLTPLAAYGLTALFVLVAWLFISGFADLNNNSRTELIELRSDLQELELLRDRDLWEERLQQSERLRSSVVKSVWTGETTSIISAQLQATLRQVATEAEHKNIRISVDPEVQDLNGSTFLRFELDSVADTSLSVFTFFLALSEHERGFQFETVDLSLNARRASIVRLSGSIPILVSDASEPTGEAREL